MLGIIGGSGLYDLPDLELVDRVLPDTPYGFPSDEITGSDEGREIAFLSRHGRGHRLTPTELVPGEHLRPEIHRSHPDCDRQRRR